MTSNESEIVIRMAQPHLERAMTGNSNGTGNISNRRISKMMVLTDYDHQLIKDLSIRIGLITGLNVEAAEALQVVNYGIGGYYTFHHDNGHLKETDFLRDVNQFDRIATWLNYMSDVESGGATVFPDIKVSVWPRQGSAVFWYNVKKNGACDRRTVHAGCPGK